MLLKEKGMQADIGVCDVLTEGASATAKHVNRLEVPVQACLSESISSEAQVKAENASLPCNPTAFVNDSSRTSQPSESPKGTLTEEPSTKEQEKKENCHHNYDTNSNLFSNIWQARGEVFFKQYKK